VATATQKYWNNNDLPNSLFSEGRHKVGQTWLHQLEVGNLNPTLRLSNEQRIAQSMKRLSPRRITSTMRKQNNDGDRHHNEFQNLISAREIKGRDQRARSTQANKLNASASASALGTRAEIQAGQVLSKPR
jgi:hypothetical protein